jgi:hypothetical protein
MSDGADAIGQILVPEGLCEADAMLVSKFQARQAAREAKDFAEADRLRDELATEHGIEINDRANTWTDAEGRIGTTDGPDYFEASCAHPPWPAPHRV